jgi:enolase
VASSSLWNVKEDRYVYVNEGVKRDSGEQLDFMRELIETYHLSYVEDPFHENDFKSFAELTRKTKNCLICGDDLCTATFRTHCII